MIAVVLSGCGSGSHSAAADRHQSTTTTVRPGDEFCARVRAAAAGLPRLRQSSYPKIVAAFADEATDIRQLADSSPGEIRTVSGRLSAAWAYQVALLRGFKTPRTKTEFRRDLDSLGASMNKKYPSLDADTNAFSNYAQTNCGVTMTG
jgi:hypothetical protein